MSGFDETNKGKRVELINTDDPYTRLKPGDKGTYQYSFMNLNEITHQISWDSGSNLAMIGGKDSFKFIEDEALKIEIRENVEVTDWNGNKSKVKMAIVQELGSGYYIFESQLYFSILDKDGKTISTVIGEESGECECFGGDAKQLDQVLAALGRTDVEKPELC